MSDETTRTDGWATADASSGRPETGQTVGASGSEAAGAVTGEGSARPVGFCQDCGRPLTAETIRAVGRGVFCEPCLETRLRQGPVSGYAAGAGQGYGAAAGPQGFSAAAGQTSGAAYGTGAGPVYGGAQSGSYTAVPPPVTSVPGEPAPALAGLLGLIPGVGAMYNGQFAKGVVHLVIFVILVSMANNVSGIFWIFVWGWIFYQSFEAYHTAKARVEGLPLPNAFGFNDIGERMGLGKGWGPVPGGRAGQPPVTPAGSGWETGGTAHAAGAPPGAPVGTAGEAAAAASVGAVPVPPLGAAVYPEGSAAVPPWTGRPTAGGDWVGYVPPTAFGQTGASQQAAAAAAREQARYRAGYAPPVYAETFTGQATTGGYVGNPYGGPYGTPVAPPERRFPVGALWLIVLGGLILLANVVPDWRIGGRWWPTILLAGFAVWLFTRRMYSGTRVACIVRWPAILMVLALLFALHAAYVVVTFGTMCAVLLIAFGALLLVERTLGASPGYGGAAGYGAVDPAGVPTNQDPGPAAFTAAAAPVSEPPLGSDEAKGGQ